MSRFFPVGPVPFGAAARLGAAFFAAVFVAVAFFAVVFLEAAFLLISAPQLARPFYSLPRPAQTRARSRQPRVELDICRYGHIFVSWHEPLRPQMHSTPLPSRSGGGFSPSLKGASVRSMISPAHYGSRSPGPRSTCACFARWEPCVSARLGKRGSTGSTRAGF